MKTINHFFDIHGNRLMFQGLNSFLNGYNAEQKELLKTHYTIREVAELLGRGYASVQREAKLYGNLYGVKPLITGRRSLWPIDKIRQLLNKHNLA